MLSSHTNSFTHDAESPAKIDLDRRAFLVVGMHRSGTSALTRVVNLLGPAAPATLLEPGPDNCRGYWESAPVVQFHDELLSTLKSGWADWSAIDADWQTGHASYTYRKALRQLIEKEFGQNSHFVSKDPRACRLLPLWLNTLSLMKIEPIALLTVRDPSEVVESLAKRNGLSPEASLALWLRHMLDAERATRGLRRAVVCYEALLADWRSEMARVSMALELSWPRSMDEAAPEIEDFLSTKLRHHQATAEDTAEIRRVAPWAADTHETLLTLRNDLNSDAALQRLDDISTQFDRASSLFSKIIREEQTAWGNRAVQRDAEMQEFLAKERANWTQDAEAQLAAERAAADTRLTNEIALWNQRLEHESTLWGKRVEDERHFWTSRLQEITHSWEARLRDEIESRKTAENCTNEHVAQLKSALQQAENSANAYISQLEFALQQARKRPLKNLRRYLRWKISMKALKLAPIAPQWFALRADHGMRRNAPLHVARKPPALASTAVAAASRAWPTFPWSAKATCATLSFLTRQKWLFSRRRLHKLEKSLEKRRAKLIPTAGAPALTTSAASAGAPSTQPHQPFTETKSVAPSQSGNHPGGFRAEALSKLLPFDLPTKEWLRKPQRPTKRNWAQVKSALETSLAKGSHEVIISISHDRYRSSVGGVQLCLTIEEAAYTARSATYIHLYPIQPLPTLAPQEAAAHMGLGISINGAFAGEVTAREALQLLPQALPERFDVTLVVHSMIGHAPEFVSELYTATAARRAFFWLHDYFGLCPSYALLRNSIKYCGAPDPQSMACSVCNAGEARSNHLERMALLFRSVQFNVVAPSEAALNVWRKRAKFPFTELHVHPHCTVKALDTPDHALRHQRPLSGRHLRVAFLGMPQLHKGWPIFCELARTLDGHPSYSFHHLGKLKARNTPTNVTFVNVQSSVDNWRAMAKAVEEQEIDVVVQASLCAETYNFITYEAISGGAFIVTLDGPGNVPLMVRELDCGIILPDERQLISAFTDGSVMDKFRLYHQQGRPEWKIDFNNVTADLHCTPQVNA